MKKLLQTKIVLIALLVAAPALAAGTAATVKSLGNGHRAPAARPAAPVSLGLTADREDDVAVAEEEADDQGENADDQGDDEQSEPAETEEQETEVEDDQGEDNDDQDEDDDDQGENEDEGGDD